MGTRQYHRIGDAAYLRERGEHCAYWTPLGYGHVEHHIIVSRHGSGWCAFTQSPENSSHFWWGYGNTRDAAVDDLMETDGGMKIRMNHAAEKTT